MIRAFKQVTLLKQLAMSQSQSEDGYKSIALIPKDSKVGVVCKCENLVNFSFYIKEWTTEDVIGTLYSEAINEDQLRFVLMGMNLENINDHVRRSL